MDNTPVGPLDLDTKSAVIRIPPPERITDKVIQWDGEQWVKVTPAVKALFEARKYEEEHKLNSFKDQ